MDIGEKIKIARLNKGLTQEDLGARVGVQKSAIAKYENGRVVNIKRSVIAALARELDLKGLDLIIESDPTGTASFHSRILSDSETLDMIEKYYSLDRTKQKIIRDLIMNLCETSRSED